MKFKKENFKGMKLEAKSCKLKANQGFTLMEIVVATTMFAVLSAGIMSLFNYTLKINRRSDALRQATQGLRNLVEVLVKEVHNGQIDYSVVNGKIQENIGNCPRPMIGDIGDDYNKDEIYALSGEELGIVTKEGERICIYGQGQDIYIKKQLISDPKKLNPSNFFVQQVTFFVRPLRDPYNCEDAECKIQPFVTFLLKAEVSLGTGEKVPILYQTTIATNNYDIMR